METEVYKIKTANFEGPFGLLLNLVEQRKLFINEISLAQVTEDYLNYVNSLGNLTPAEITSFLLVAATLILIKSKSLLPNLNLTDEEEGDIKNLEDRLRLYEFYNRLALNLKDTFGKRIIFSAGERKLQAWGNTTLIFLPDDQITTEFMMTFAQNALGRIPKKVFLPEVEVRKVISLEEMINKLTDRIQTSLTMNFKDFTGRAVSKEERIVVIVGFLAMLELIRNGILNAMQENNFEDIIIEKSAPVEELETIVEIYE